MNKTALIPFPILLFAIGFSLLIIGSQIIQPALIYLRESILAGEAWRLWSTHLVHTNYNHMYLNLAGLWIFLLLCGSALTLKLLIFSIFLSATLIGIALLVLHPEIQWYAGFSGVLYGLFVVGAICLALSGEIPSFIALMALIVIKLGAGWLGGADGLTQDLIQASIVEESHLYGILGGCLAVTPYLYSMFRQSRGY